MHRIVQLENDNGDIMNSDKDMENIFVRFFENILGVSEARDKCADDLIFNHGHKLSIKQQMGLINP